LLVKEYGVEAAPDFSNVVREDGLETKTPP